MVVTCTTRSTCRIVSVWTVMVLITKYRGVVSLNGCAVRVRPHVLGREPSHLTRASGPSVTPLVQVYMGFVDIDVDVTGSPPSQVCLFNDTIDNLKG